MLSNYTHFKFVTDLEQNIILALIREKHFTFSSPLNTVVCFYKNHFMVEVKNKRKNQNIFSSVSSRRLQGKLGPPSGRQRSRIIFSGVFI